MLTDGEDSKKSFDTVDPRRPEGSSPILRASPKSATLNKFERGDDYFCIFYTLTVQLASTRRFSAFRSRCKMGGDALNKIKRVMR
jgi:hypothetical protein